MDSAVPFDTNVFFAGGAGIFIEYHDIAKPAYLMAIVKLLASNIDCGLPIDSIKHMSIISLTEWYLRRRYRNPLKSLDYLGKYDDDTLDDMMLSLLRDDPSIYRLAPAMNLHRMLAGYSKQGFTFPLYFYTETNEPGVAEDCKLQFQGIPVTYLYGDLAEAIGECSQNFTYMVSNIDTVKKLSVLLAGTCSHILLAGDYRYNYSSTSNHELKVDLDALARSTPYLRMEINTVCDPTDLATELCQIAGRKNHEEDI